MLLQIHISEGDVQNPPHRASQSELKIILTTSTMAHPSHSKLHLEGFNRFLTAPLGGNLARHHSRGVDDLPAW